MLRRIVLTAASVVALAAAANAADMYAPAGGGYKDGYVPVNTWTGFYIGAGVGPDWGKSTYSDASIANGTFQPDRAFGGGQFGYNFQRGHFVFGVEADLGVMDLSVGQINANTKDYGMNGGFYADVTGRLGYAMDRTLLYAKGGAAWLDTKFSVNNGGAVSSTSPTVSGWTAGAGIEFMLLRSWSIKAEYLHYSFESSSFADGAGGKVRFEPDVDTVKFGVNYHVHDTYEPLK
jgi:outer membrane immunogenic protein